MSDQTRSRTAMLLAVTILFIFCAVPPAEAVTSKIVRQSTSSALLKGETEDLIIGSRGTIQLGLAAEVVAEEFEHVWSVNSIVPSRGAVYIGTSPNGGIYKSTDAGASWSKKTRGLPDGDVGKIGLAVTAADPRLVYATIEADEENKGFYRSSDQGESWTHKNDYISGGTGPHYYMELTASQQTADLVFQMDVFFRVTRDGGENFSVLGTGREKHSDHHALAFDHEVVDGLLQDVELGLALDDCAYGLPVQGPIGLGAGRPHGRALARIERTKLDAGAIDCPRHGSTERVDLPRQVALANAANGRVAAHLPEAFPAVRDKQRASAGACGGQ